MSKISIELIEKSKKLSPNDRIIEAKNDLEKIKSFCLDVGLNENQTASFIMNLVKMFVDADNKVALDEYYLFTKITGMEITYEAFKNSTSLDDIDFANLTKNQFKAIYALPNDVKLLIAKFGIMFSSSDGDISFKEKEIVERILEGIEE